MNESNMEARCLLSFPMSAKKGDVICRALLVEGENQVPKTEVSLVREGARLLLEITAEDSSSLRACVNSYMNWISSLNALIETL
ncbi:MAG: KEOPS complex subunit Pcc1 [Candidatus Thermoplasmatota archaeon]|jgi:tRNA threonylcarbamoyladenosine modification (KEOPS) complex  Pcc1 subunit|nr:KEOPS complex subunit Pcc1 [Candidatus Thermoplasmatota archaeon]